MEELIHTKFHPSHIKFSPDVWGKYYWFFLHTLAYSYPETPTSITKRKYYDFIQNLPLFIPNYEIGDKFSVLLDKYPVSPYLENRESFIRWTIFIHNKINQYLGYDELSFQEANDIYVYNYTETPIIIYKSYRIQKSYIYLFILMTMFCIILYSMIYKL